MHAKGYPLILLALMFLMEEIGSELVEMDWGEFVRAKIDIHPQQVEVDLVLLFDLPTDEGLEIVEVLLFRVVIPYLADEYQLGADEAELPFLLAIFESLPC